MENNKLDQADVFEPISMSAYSPEFAQELINRLGSIFARLRAKADVSQAALSQKTGIALKLIDDFERGQHDIDIDTLIKLLDGIKVSMVELFSDFEVDTVAQG